VLFVFVLSRFRGSASDSAEEGPMDGTVSNSTDTGSTTTGPTSFSDTSLTWTEDSSASTPSPESTPPASASADATVPPAADASTEDTTPGAGEPPRERWNDILANARAKAAEEAIAPLSWAKQVSQQEYQQVAELAKRASADPIGYLQDFIKELQGSPEHAAQLRSLAARALAQRQAQPTESQEPEFMLPQPDGSIAFDPAGFASWKQWQQKQLLAQVQERLQPYQQTHEQLQAERAAAKEHHESQQFASTVTADVKTWPGVTEDAMKAMADVIRTDPKLPAKPTYADLDAATNRAYRAVVAPTLTQKAQAKLLDNLQQKATASTSVNPGSAAAGSPRAVHRFSDLPPDAWK
jgi:Fe-S cluster biosynthesis and repair protein YggX